jgi:hypothetical protein
MKHSDFIIGCTFRCSDRVWRCTDIGTRTIIAIRIESIETVVSGSEGQQGRRTLSQSGAEAGGWFKGPPYAVAEEVFDEIDIEGCAADLHGK